MSPGDTPVLYGCCLIRITPTSSTAQHQTGTLLRQEEEAEISFPGSLDSCFQKCRRIGFFCFKYSVLTSRNMEFTFLSASHEIFEQLPGTRLGARNTEALI